MTYYRVGDIGLTGVLAQGWVSRLIKLGARVAGYPADARRFSHAFLVVSERGDIVEAVKRGVRPAHISKYDPNDIELLSMAVDPHDAQQIVKFATSVVAAHYSYGYWSFAACGLNCLLAHFGRRPLIFGVAHTKICSAFVADALTRAGVDWDKPEEVVMPADIWQQFGDRAR